MKKTERINTMMRYINNRSYFTISEIMREFNISRSTAMRDIKEIEIMGMPLVSEVGRTGGYAVMNNSVLPSVRFTDNEVKALFVAFMASRNQQLPFLKSRQSLAEKLLGLIPQNQQDNLVLLNQILLFEGTNPHHPDLLDLTDLAHPILEKLIKLLLIDRHLSISYKTDNVIQTYNVFILHLYREKNLWQIESFDLTEAKRMFFVVDKLHDVQLSTTKTNINRKKVLEILRKQREENNLIINLGPKAITQFKKYHPLKCSLSYTNPFQASATVKAFIDINIEEELTEIINWLLFLGEDIKFIKVPEAMIEGLQARLAFYN